MINPEALSVEEIEAILCALDRSDEEVEAELKAHAWRIRHGTAPMPEVAKNLQLDMERMLESAGWVPFRRLMAQRLHANDRAVPLFSRKEAGGVMRALVMETFRLLEATFPDGTPPMPAELKDKIAEIAVLLVGSGAIETMLGITCDEGGPKSYEAYWRSIRTVCEIANERGMSLAEILALPGCELDDTVTCRTLSYSEYTERGRAGVDRATQFQRAILTFEKTARESGLEGVTALFKTGIPPAQGVKVVGQVASYRDAYIIALHQRARRIYGDA